METVEKTCKCCIIKEKSKINGGKKDEQNKKFICLSAHCSD